MDEDSQEPVQNHKGAVDNRKQSMAKVKPKKKAFGLTPEKKKRLKVIIMQKVAEK